MLTTRYSPRQIKCPGRRLVSLPSSRLLILPPTCCISSRRSPVALPAGLVSAPFNEPPADAVVTDSRLSAPAQRVALLVN